MSHPEKIFENGKESNTIRISLNPIDWHKGLREQIENAEKEFSKLPHMKNALHDIVERMSKRYCDVCFFGKPKVEAYGENLCEECAKALYGFDTSDKHPTIKPADLYYQLWYRRQKALPIFEAYLHAELERYKLELKLEEVQTCQKDSSPTSPE